MAAPSQAPCPSFPLLSSQQRALPSVLTSSVLVSPGSVCAHDSGISPLSSLCRLSPTPDSPAQSFLVLSRHRSGSTQHLFLGIHRHLQPQTANTTPDCPAHWQSLSQQLRPSRLSAPKQGHPFSPAPHLSHWGSQNLSRVWLFLTCPLPSTLSYLLCLYWTPNQSPWVSPVPTAALPQGPGPETA